MISLCLYTLGLREEVQKRLDKLVEPPPVKAPKPLPKPDDAPRKKRGGKRSVLPHTFTVALNKNFVFVCVLQSFSSATITHKTIFLHFWVCSYYRLCRHQQQWKVEAFIKLSIVCSVECTHLQQWDCLLYCLVALNVQAMNMEQRRIEGGVLALEHIHISTNECLHYKLLKYYVLLQTSMEMLSLRVFIKLLHCRSYYKKWSNVLLTATLNVQI